MNAGRLSDRIVFETRSVTENADGGFGTAWDTAFSSDVEAQRLSEMACRFIMRYRAGISPQGPLLHRIIWEGVIWVIDSAVHDRKRTMLTLDCSQGELVDVTHLTSTETEYIDGVPVRRPQSE